MNDLKTMSELEMRDSDVPWPKSEKELLEYVNILLEREHDYGTCVYAVSMASIAMYYYMSHRMGITGFQAGCASNDFLRRAKNMEDGFQIINFNDLLYPQYIDKFPTYSRLINQNIDHLKQKAKQLLEERGEVHEEVRRHWKMLSEMEVEPKDE